MHFVNLYFEFNLNNLSADALVNNSLPNHLENSSLDNPVVNEHGQIEVNIDNSQNEESKNQVKHETDLNVMTKTQKPLNTNKFKDDNIFEKGEEGKEIYLGIKRIPSKYWRSH